MGVSIVTDSACDLTPADARAREIDIVPIWLVYGSERLRDGIDITREAFYARCRERNELPATQTPAVAEFEERFGGHVRAGNDVLHISVSSALSKAYGNAVEAAGGFLGRVRVLNSGGSSAGMALLCTYARELADQGATLDELAERLSIGVLKRATFFSTPDVHVLAEGGRLSKSAAALGSMENLSLVLKMDEKGAIAPAGQSQSFERTCEVMVDALARAIGGAPTARVAVSHADRPDAAAKLREQLGSRLGVSEIGMYETSATIATHRGIGSVGVYGIVP